MFRSRQSSSWDPRTAARRSSRIHATEGTGATAAAMASWPLLWGPCRLRLVLGAGIAFSDFDYLLVQKRRVAPRPAKPSAVEQGV